MSAERDVGRAVLALDGLLCRDDAATLLADLRTLAPTWLLDQLDAAAGQVRAGMDAVVAAGLAAGIQERAAAQHPGWVRLGLLDTLLAWSAGRASTCLHSPDPRRPEPVSAAAWTPGLVVCGRCPHLLRLPRESTADRTCDGCGRLTTGVEHGDGIWPSTVIYGAFTYAFGTCRDCRYWPDPEETT